MKTRGLHLKVVSQLSVVVGPLMALVLENMALLAREGVRTSNAPPDIANEVGLECEVLLYSGLIVAQPCRGGSRRAPLELSRLSQ